ncbi:hypothetical protein DSM107007_48330 [Nostoc sp. PCC 7120 = FACHB-418]|uniref:Uncharacterized protein n=2 Tax=Nostocaceae TaxID=1162 RepID=A0A1Z4KJC7_ANAVA|nr:hypothetical protein DSM107007_48330 [Nostoc sp. PCC 7120 = FACHB-418]BAB75063.1 alr3364 [Nostoc sp. PCC 7120 = FACHB-418]BAY68994.1 hypothetical protein NIES23_17840 [Trichormus variabilis NIES-23]
MGGSRVMNEANTSNNRAVMESPNSSANSLQPEQTICPFYTVVPSENTTNAKLPLLNPAEDEQDEIPTADSPQDEKQQDWVGEPDGEKQAQVETEFQKLLALNEELRAANNQLYQRVEHLQDDLAESEKALQWQKRRSSVTESMLNQQAQELAAAQEQIQSLFQQLETAVQTTQRQEILIDSYKAQLQISQQRIAQLERECSLLQTNYSEQSQQVVQSENACRELRTRLMRQQRQTLQFKAALEKCLETSIPNYESPDEDTSNTQNTVPHKTRFARKARSLFPNAEPIKPWTAEADSQEEDTNQSWEEPKTPRPFTSDYSMPNPPSLWNWPVKDKEKEDIRIISQPPEPAPKEDESPIPPEEAPSVGSAELDQQIDSLIQMFFASQPGGMPPTPPASEAVGENTPVDTTIWETSATSVEEEETPEQLWEPMVEVSPSPTNSSFSFTVSPTEKPAEVPEQDHSAASPVNEVEFPMTDLAPDSFDEFANDTQSPSPVVYPQRPRKGRKSLASVELPNFHKPNGQ